jgi:hypothetical protein
MIGGIHVGIRNQRLAVELYTNKAAQEQGQTRFG